MLRRFQPGCPCCCDCTCGDCSGTKAPCCFRVTLSGIVNDDGTCCDQLNTTYYLRQSPDDDCLWTTTLCPSVCGFRSVDLRISGTKATVSLGGHQWEKDFGSPINCCRINDNLSNIVNAGGSCDTSASTAIVRATTTCPQDSCCAYCEEGSTPLCLSVTLDGFANKNGANCGGCDCINGVTVGTQLVGGIYWPYSCLWRGSISAPCYCNNLTVEVYLNYLSGNYVLQGYVSAGGGVATYSATLGPEKPKCYEWTDVGLALVTSSDTKCDMSGTSLMVSAGSPPCNEPYPTDPAESALLSAATFCQDCGDTWPSTIYVELSGFGDNYPWLFCDECADLNDVYALTTNLLWCGHSINWGSYICCVEGLVADWYLSSGNVLIRLGWASRLFGEPEWFAQWNLGPAPIDCSTFNGTAEHVTLWGYDMEDCGCGWGISENPTVRIWW